MNMNLMAEKIFVVVEFGLKENVLGAIVVHEEAFFLHICIMSKTNYLDVII